MKNLIFCLALVPLINGCGPDRSEKNQTPVPQVETNTISTYTNASDIKTEAINSTEGSGQTGQGHNDSGITVIPIALKQSYKTCTTIEFSTLSAVMDDVKKANALISVMGSEVRNWSYNGPTVIAAGSATRGCESLIKYHGAKPCQYMTPDKINKYYDGQTLRERCEKARTYYYDFAQNKSTLIFPNADLFLSINHFTNKVFEYNHISEFQGCRIENTKSPKIDYSNQNLVKIKDTRGFSDSMMVLETTEGLLIQCYGLNLGAAFSKRQIVNLLKDQETVMPLIYKLK